MPKTAAKIHSSKRIGEASGRKLSLRSSKTRSPRSSVSISSKAENLSYIVQDGEQYVLVPVDEYEKLIMADMAREAIAQIESGDNDFVDADDFALELAGEWIAKARKAKGLTQNQLGKKLGIPQSQVSRIEKNPDRTTVRTLKKVAKALGVNLKGIVR